MLAQLYHVAVAGYYLFVGQWMLNNVVLRTEFRKLNEKSSPVENVQNFSLRYLTNWTFTLQSIFFVTSIFLDILQAISGNERLKNKLRNIHSYMFTVLAGTSAVLVSLIFWGIWFIDRNLIFPKELDKFLPMWINHSLHTTTSLFVIGEMTISYHKFPTFKQALPAITSYLALYTVCLLGTYFQHGAWLYPFLKDLDWNARTVFFLGTYALAITIFGLNKLINSFIWRKKNETVSKKKQKKKH